MMEKEFDQKEGHIQDSYGMGVWEKELGRDFKVALLRKRERILEAKLEFVREINRLIKKEAPKAAAEEKI